MVLCSRPGGGGQCSNHYGRRRRFRHRIWNGRKPSMTHTQLAIEVEDVEGAVRDLQAKGVKFEEYDSPGLKTVNGIADLGGNKVAWFKDSEGNLIAVGLPVAVAAPART